MDLERKPDFSGWVTKNGVMCADGRTMAHGAFKEQDKMRVPLVWAHKHNDPELILGHTILEERPEGTYGYSFFNDGVKAKASAQALEHGDVDSMSIWANHLTERAGIVTHGIIREVSLVLAGANPGAKIENVHIQHGMDTIELEDEIIVTMGEKIEHAAPEDDPDESIEDILDTMTPKQRDAVAALVVAAAAGEIEHSAIEETEQTEEVTDPGAEPTDQTEEQTEEVTEVEKKDPEEEPPAPSGDSIQHSQEGHNMDNVFEGDAAKAGGTLTISHDDMKKIMTRGAELNSFKSALEEHLEHAEGDYGIRNIDELFPNAKNIRQTPDWIKRKTDWVDGIINGASHQPFTRIRSMSADITHEEARALGYIKGNLKKEEFFDIKSRVTTPTTIYKKQKLDRDDILDITEFDVVVWLKGEMRMMLEEEIARAVLFGDGRPVELDNGDVNPDKINENNIRPVLTDNDFYSHKIEVALSDDGSDVQEWMEAVLRSRKVYKGTGSPVFYTSEDRLTDALLSRDGVGRRHFKTVEDVAAELRVSRIVTIDLFEKYQNVIGILVNISDYTIGTDAGGNIASFEDFDIDYNQHKYLLETRLSGALTRHKSAIVFLQAASDAVTPGTPTKSGNDVTIPTTANVAYFVDGKKVTGTYTLTEDKVVTAEALNGKYIALGAKDEWAFTFTPA